MRISLILLFSIILQLSAKDGYAQRTRIPISMNNASIEQVLNKIEETSDFVFLYNNKIIQTDRIISVQNENGQILELLNEVFRNTNIVYTVVDKQIILSTNKLNVISQNPAFQLKGVVKDAKGEPLIGVNVKVKGSGKGTITDVEGNFTIQVPKGEILEISYVGYETQFVNVKENTPLDIKLQEDNNVLNEVVVTALGIKREEKALSYNVQQIKSEDLVTVKNANFMNSLVGKVAGVTINASSAGIGGAARVVMRGPKSINYDNNALYVIDGIPMTNGGGQINDLYSCSTSSDNISSVNPEDIESVSVLTGAAASSLYGSIGQNGVILVTTKSGISGKPRLTYSNSTSFLTPFVMPRFQNTYGQTEEGSFSSWGEKLDTPSDYSPKDFFQTGNSVTNALTFSAGTEKNQTFISAAVLTAKGIIPNNTLRRYNFTFRNTVKLLEDKLAVDFNMMYIYQKEKNMFAQGLYHNPLVPIYLFPPGGNINNIQAFERHDASRNFPTQYWPFADDQFRMQNPYWITNRENFKKENNRLFTGVSVKYNLFDWLRLEGRTKLERTNSTPETTLAASTNPLFAGDGGRYYRGQSANEQYYFDMLANIEKSINEDFSVVGNIGYSRTDNKDLSQSVESYIPLGAIPNLFTTDNSAGVADSYLPSRKSFQALFGNAELSYKRMIYLSASYRSDWWSQLYGTGKLYITYPSVGTSVVLSDLLNIHSDIVSFIKVRGNYTIVGNPPPAYVTGTLTYPVSSGSPDFSNGIKPSLTLQPERTKGVELGFNLKMFKNKLNLDVTLYHTRTYNQIFNVPISASSFYSSFYINAGQVNNKGIEAALGYNGKIGNVDWESNATFTMNKNKVVKLIKDYYDAETDQYITRDAIEKGGAGSYSMKVAVGGTLSDVYTTTLKMDNQGRYVVVNKGKVSADDKTIIFAGQAAPDCTIGYTNSFSWKNINLSFSVFGRFGGIGVSATQAMMDSYGVSEQSAKARERGNVKINGLPLSGVKDYYTVMGNGVNGVLSEYVYSATNVRLKNLSIGYTIPGKWLHNKIKSINLAFTGENLFMFYNKSPFDPENTASTGTYYQGIDYFMQPSLRSLGFSVRMDF